MIVKYRGKTRCILKVKQLLHANMGRIKMNKLLTKLAITHIMENENQL